MKIIGRNREKDVLSQCLLSKRPEFAAVYGRRRVGKTYAVTKVTDTNGIRKIALRAFTSAAHPMQEGINS